MDRYHSQVQRKTNRKMSSTQKIIEETVTLLAEHYNFDAKKAIEYVLNIKKATSAAYTRAKKAADGTRAKIAELEQKIADKKVKNAEKSGVTLAGLQTKLAEQLERISKFETPSSSDAEADTPPPSDTEAVPEKKKRVSKKKEVEPEAAAEPAEKRISRMTPTLSKQLKTTFEEAHTEFTDAHKKEFAAYINDMLNETFDVKSLPDHMRDFVVMQVVKTPVDKASLVPVSYEELVTFTTVETPTPGVYWDTVNKVFIRGPNAVPDEEVVETTFEGALYVVGEVSKRVYVVGDTDVFVGFAGVGAFKNM